jgi:outer membrane biosynthesis protein TonB
MRLGVHGAPICFFILHSSFCLGKMLPQAKPPKRRNSSRVNLLISFVFHVVVVTSLVYFAARQGFLGKQMKKIAIEMVKEKPPEKPKEKEPEKPKDETPKVEPSKVAEAPKVETPRVAQAAPPPAMVAPPAVAPPPAEVPSFVFDGGKVVQSSSDPVELYRGLVESALRAKWNRPGDRADDKFVAEVEVAIDRKGQISQPEMKKKSGDAEWDDSVRRAIAAAGSIGHAPPTNFPPRVLVRFDVQADAESIGP